MINPQYRSTRLTTAQSTLASEVIPGYLNYSTLVYDSADAISACLNVLKAEEVICQKGRLRCLRSIIKKVMHMQANRNSFVVYGENQIQRANKNDRVIKCTVDQVRYLRDDLKLPVVRWQSLTAAKTCILVAENDVTALVQRLQDAYYDEVVPQHRRMISSVARKIEVDGEPVDIHSDNDVASQDRYNCLKYACMKLDLPFDEHADTIGDMISHRYIDPVITELKTLAALVRGSSKICWSLISKLERLRGVKPSYDGYQIEQEVLKNKVILYQEPVVVEQETVELDITNQLVDQDESGPNCFFADTEDFVNYEDDEDEDDDIDADWFVYSGIPNLIDALFIEADEDAEYELDGTDISFKDEDARDDWCEEMKQLVESLGEELDDVTLDLCFQELLRLQAMASLV